MGITFFNQWKNKATEFDLICVEYKHIYDQVDETTNNVLILGLLGFGMVIAINVK